MEDLTSRFEDLESRLAASAQTIAILIKKQQDNELLEPLDYTEEDLDTVYFDPEMN